MATVTIPHTIDIEVSGDAEFTNNTFNYDDMTLSMRVKFNNDYFAGVVNAKPLYNGLTVDEKATVLKWEKIKTVETFNDAMGTSFTWNQVPNSIFD